jgi:hypothetical protein
MKITYWETNDYDGGYEDFLEAINPYNYLTQEEKDEWDQHSKKFKQKLIAIAKREGRYYE